MKIYSEISLSNFEFWNGGRDNAIKLDYSQLDDLECHVEEILGDEASDTAINDLFWFDFEMLLECLGLTECENCGELHGEEFCEECFEECQECFEVVLKSDMYDVFCVNCYNELQEEE